MNCGDYEISNGALGRAIGTFHKDQIAKDQIARNQGSKSLVKE